ncbi:MAG: hypothetical protein CL823_04545 [Crocinitomicaceae bacterium]|nr:hypothetical protein [Crocinitomicaceae bacterium]
MLKSLHIKNYALINELKLDFDGGLTVVTGETGSGKSILLGALGLALGDRATSSSVRHGSTVCSVDATFHSEEVSAKLIEWEIEPTTSCLIHIRREVTSSGRSKSFINDSQTSVSTLKEVGSLLVDLHGQDETRALLERETRLDYLDKFGLHFEIRDSYRASYGGWRSAERKLAELESIAAQPQSDVNYLQFQLVELDELCLSNTNWEELEEELLSLKNATELASGFNWVYESLSQSNLGEVIKTLESISSYSSSAKELLERIRSCKIEIEDIASEANSLSENTYFDSEKSAILEEKLDGLKRALLKHRLNTPEELIRLQSSLQLKIESANNLEGAIDKAKDLVLDTKAKMMVAGEALKTAREKCGVELLKLVHQELKPLKLPDVQIDWTFTEANSPDLNGIEDVELLFSANPGSPQKPLTQIASGGERSRVMLAFKAAVATKNSVPTIVLDEIDTGVSGDVASRMATSMKAMSKKQQVFSVTHLAQVAALGDSHLEVTKETSSKDSKTQAQFLSGDHSIEAIAKMLSGSNITKEARAQARVLRSSNQ